MDSDNALVMTIRLPLTDQAPARDSASSSRRLQSMPQRNPDRLPSLRTTRWQGMATASLLEPQAFATARKGFGRTDGPGDIRVTCRLSRRDFGQRLPDFLLKLGTLYIERYIQGLLR